MVKKKKQKTKNYTSIVYGAITNYIRLLFLRSPNRREALLRARVFEEYVLKNGKVRTRCVGYKCECCGEVFPTQKDMQVHHKQPVGGLSTYPVFSSYINSMFCDANELEVLCIACHHAKHHGG